MCPVNDRGKYRSHADETFETAKQSYSASGQSRKVGVKYGKTTVGINGSP